MLYTEKEKHEIERVKEVFAEHLRQSPDFELLWSDKVGYVWLTIGVNPVYVDTPPKDGDCVLPKAPCWEPMISAVCSNHPGEATLPLRWLCQLPLCRLAAEKRLQAIIPRQQVYIPPPDRC